MEPPRAVLFDLDGVLVDSREVWFRLLNAAAERFGAPPIDAAAFEAMWGQGVDADAKTLDCPIDRLEAFYNEHFMSFSEALLVDPVAQVVLERVHAAGIRSAVVTNTPQPLACDILDAARLSTEIVVGGTDVPRPKPAPDMVLRACALLGVAPSASVLIGDSAFDREAAAAAKVRFVGLRIDGEKRIQRLDELLELLGI